MNDNLIPAPAKYHQLKGNTSLVYDAICKVLSERQEQVDWAQFGQAEWQLLASMAEAEGVGPLLYWKLKAVGSGQCVVESPDTPASGWRNEHNGGVLALMPAAVWKFLQTSYYKTAARNAVLLGELDRILAAFEAAKIPVIVLKGAALAQTVYPDPGLRPMGDLDLLIPESCVYKTFKLLKKQYAFLEAKGDHLIFFKQEAGILLEIHWGLSGSYQHEPFIPTSMVNVDKQAGQNVLSTPWQIVHLSTHLTRHSTKNNLILKWVMDLYILLGLLTQDDQEALVKITRNYHRQQSFSEMWVILQLHFPDLTALLGTQFLSDHKKDGQLEKARYQIVKEAFQALPLILWPPVAFLYLQKQIFKLRTTG
ncbi:MAG TPA: hypothetical protein DEH25_17405 [Chloroflexi bacterium]|nr:hypothetical protein [Chloroflexota bacterium]